MLLTATFPALPTAFVVDDVSVRESARTPADDRYLSIGRYHRPIW
jgi:hypothetical protein